MDKPAINKQVVRLFEQMASIDELAMVTLKGHLMLEEQLEAILERFMFHAEFLKQANLRFFQKASLARSLSLDEHQNSMWELLLAINSLRNELSHKLQSPDRQRKFAQVMTLLEKEGVAPSAEPKPDHERLALAVALVSGFLHTFEAEATRFQSVVQKLDEVMNPHRRNVQT